MWFIIGEVASGSLLFPKLCNVLYNIGAKVIVNHLKGIMDAIISQPHGAFVPGSLISDNFLVASEVGHYLHNLRRGKRGFLALKLDMSKAYDHVEWGFFTESCAKNWLWSALDWNHYELLVLFCTWWIARSLGISFTSVAWEKGIPYLPIYFSCVPKAWLV